MIAVPDGHFRNPGLKTFKAMMWGKTLRYSTWDRECHLIIIKVMVGQLDVYRCVIKV